VLAAFFLNLSPGGEKQVFWCIFLESLIFLLQSGCVVSPIPGCGVAGSRSEASVLYLLTITSCCQTSNMIPLTGSTFLVWHHLKNSKYAINEDKPLHKFDVQEIWSAEYTYLLRGPNSQSH
jgi:hypothetical protein